MDDKTFGSLVASVDTCFSEPVSAAGRSRLAVVGNPILHSKSPQLHNAAFQLMRLPWEYSRWQIPSGGLAQALNRRTYGWLGLSVTAPLKAEALAFACQVSEDAHRSGAANTLIFESLSEQAEARAENTDIPGIVAAFVEQDINIQDGIAQIIGSGQTAASAVVAAERMGATRIELYARRPRQAQLLADRLGANVTAQPLENWRLNSNVSLVVDTIPGGYQFESEIDLTQDCILLSAAYDPWPTPLVELWQKVESPIVTGLDMLLHQAIYQLRLFLQNNISAPIPKENEVLKAMRAALT